MLGKLIKHEFKATWRTFVPIYIALAVLTIAGSVILNFSDEMTNSLLIIATGFSAIIGVFAMIFAFLSPFIFLSMRFYRTTATREAYLTFTVPAKTHHIIFAKFIVAFIWSIVTFAVALCAIAIIVYFAEGENILEFMRLTISAAPLKVCIIQITSIILGVANSILSIFAAIALGQLVRDHRVIASLAFYAAIYTVQQIISVIVTLPQMISIIRETESPIKMDIYAESPNEFPMMVISLICVLVFSVVEYFITCHFLKKKLNLL